MKSQVLLLLALSCLWRLAAAQEMAPPVPQRLDIHSLALKENRVLWVRTPPGCEQSKSVYPVVYQTDAPGHVNWCGLRHAILTRTTVPPCCARTTRDCGPSSRIWRAPRDPKTGEMIGGLAGVEQHCRTLSERFGYRLEPPENTLNNLGYRLMGEKKWDQAIAVLKRNVELYPESANVYDSLGEALEAAGKYDSAAQNFQKTIDAATRSNDGSLPSFRQHLERVTAEESASAPRTPARHEQEQQEAWGSQLPQGTSS